MMLLRSATSSARFDPRDRLAVAAALGAWLVLAGGWHSAGLSTARGERISYRITGGFLPGPVDPLGVAGGTFALDLQYDRNAPPIEGTDSFALYDSVGGFLQLFDTPIDGVYPASSRAGVTEAVTDSLLFQVRPTIDGQTIVSQLSFVFTGNSIVSGTPPQLPTDWPPNGVTALTSFLLGPEITNVVFQVAILPDRITGDADGDGSVGAGDYALWAAQFGQSGSGLTADFNYDGTVGAADYALWAANFGKTFGGGNAGGGRSVPEPATAGLLIPGAIGWWLVASRGARRSAG